MGKRTCWLRIAVMVFLPAKQVLIVAIKNLFIPTSYCGCKKPLPAWESRVIFSSRKRFVVEYNQRLPKSNIQYTSVGRLVLTPAYSILSLRNAPHFLLEGYSSPWPYAYVPPGPVA